MSLLKVSDISIKFGGLTAVNKVCLDVPKGSIVSVIGPNGAGKTTLFNIITGIYSPTSGKIFLDNKDLRLSLGTKTILKLVASSLLFGVLFTVFINAQTLWEQSIVNNFIYGQAFDWGLGLKSFFRWFLEAPFKDSLMPFCAASLVCLAALLITWNRARHSPSVVSCKGLSRTFQNIRLFKEMTVLENVLVAMDKEYKSSWLSVLINTKSFKRESAKHLERAKELISFVGLDDKIDQSAGSLPYGLQRRLEIARGLATNPNILLLDEPAAGLNPSELGDLNDLIRAIRGRGVTVILIEHHMRLVMDLSDHITVLEYGNKIAEGTPEEIRQNKRVIAAYLGEASHE